MKILFVILVLIMSSTTLAESIQNRGKATENSAQLFKTQRVGFHGMLLFSDGKTLYASHLPMFHVPHDLQVIFSFEIEDKETELALLKALNQETQYWTLSPEKFDLNLLAAANASSVNLFKADLFAGHFERGGELRFANQSVKVKKLLLKRKLTKEKQNLATLLRLTPEDTPRHFYVRLIAGRPGIDQLFKVHSDKTVPKRLLENLQLRKGELSISEEEVAQALQLPKSQIDIYYQETGDLL